MQIGDAANEQPVNLLRPRRVNVAGAQPRLDMRDRDVVIKGGERPGKGRGCVPLDDDPVGAPGGENPADPRQHRAGQIGEVLIGPHDVEVPVRPQLEEFEKLRQDFAVLAGRANPAVEVGAAGQFPDDRRQLDGFGPGAEDKEQLHQTGRL